jgi:hypothetical protein
MHMHTSRVNTHAPAVHVPLPSMDGGQAQAWDEVIIVCKLGHLAAVVQELVHNLGWGGVGGGGKGGGETPVRVG